MGSNFLKNVSILLPMLLTFSLFAEGDVLKRFYIENNGKTLRRIPSWIVPENAFAGFQLTDEGKENQKRILEFFRDECDYNVLTYCCRVAEHFNPAVTSRLHLASQILKGSGIELLMETDPRLMRNEFLKRYPEDHLSMRQFGIYTPAKDGSVTFSIKQDYMCDYSNTSGFTDPYTGWKNAKVISAKAVKENSFRLLNTNEIKCTKSVVSGKVSGLNQDEKLLIEIEWPLKEIDPCSPKLPVFVRETALRYKAAGASGAMRDEYGFQKPNVPAFKKRLAFWYSPHFAKLYEKRSGGRNLNEDLPILALGEKTPQNNKAAIDYTMSIYDACTLIEKDLYDLNKEYFGADTYIAKHVTWHAPFAWDELLHNGLSWWGTKRDWAQSDEYNKVPASTGMMKKFGTPLWMNEGYGPNPEHYVKTLWQYMLCGGRIVYHGIFNWDKSKTSIARYRDPKEKEFRKHADIMNHDGMRAQQISRLLPLMTRAPIDCPVAHIFGHDRLVNWLGKAHCDWGEKIAHSLGSMGYYVDAYPASEIALNTFSIDKDGYLSVGKQKYLACSLYHLSYSERSQWDKMIKSRKLKTKIFPDANFNSIALFLKSQNAIKQTPLEKTGMGGKTWNRLPKSDGVMRLTDGTQVRVKGAYPNLAGDEIKGEFEFGSDKVSYKARGLFAARVENGILIALCGGEVTQVEGPGISINLATPADIVLVKIDGKWHGVWQTKDLNAPIPAPLLTITPRWIKLRGNL